MIAVEETRMLETIRSMLSRAGRVEWDDAGSRLYRNDTMVLDIDASAAGTFFGPQALYASLGNPRPLEVDSAGMPIGITFSDVVVEGITGPEATCG
jgi:hypothetical protein